MPFVLAGLVPGKSLANGVLEHPALPVAAVPHPALLAARRGAHPAPLAVAEPHPALPAVVAHPALPAAVARPALLETRPGASLLPPTAPVRNDRVAERLLLGPHSAGATASPPRSTETVPVTHAAYLPGRPS